MRLCPWSRHTLHVMPGFEISFLLLSFFAFYLFNGQCLKIGVKIPVCAVVAQPGKRSADHHPWGDQYTGLAWRAWNNTAQAEWRGVRIVIPRCVRNVQLLVKAWAGLHLTWCLMQQRHLVHAKQHNTCSLDLDSMQICFITFVILWQQRLIGTNEKWLFATVWLFCLFVLVNENNITPLADTVKHDGKAPASSKAKARKGKLGNLPKTDSKAAMVRWPHQHGSFRVFI